MARHHKSVQHIGALQSYKRSAAQFLSLSDLNVQSDWYLSSSHEKGMRIAGYHEVVRPRGTVTDQKGIKGCLCLDWVEKRRGFLIDSRNQKRKHLGLEGILLRERVVMFEESHRTKTKCEVTETEK